MLTVRVPLRSSGSDLAFLRSGLPGHQQHGREAPVRHDRPSMLIGYFDGLN